MERRSASPFEKLGVTFYLKKKKPRKLEHFGGAFPKKGFASFSLGEPPRPYVS